MNHLQAKTIVDSALPTLTPEERLVVRGISDLETFYGQWGSDPARGAGSNNMGAITDPSYKQGDPPTVNQFLHSDSRPNPGGIDEKHPDGLIHYTTAFRRYATPAAGFVDVAATALKPNVKAAIKTGSLRAVSAVMFANHYFTGVLQTPKQNIDAHAKRLIQCVSDMTLATGEPNPFMPVTQEMELKAGPPLAHGSLSLVSPDSSSTLPPILRFGSVGPHVQAWQRLIKAPADGDFGPMTRRMTREWQAAHGLIDDGIVGPLSWSMALGKK